MNRTSKTFDASDPSTAVRLAENIWWVGHILPDDPFQCHAYLIENNDQSVLIDPGSSLTFKHTFRKIESIIPFRDIRYFVCQHQDPDITGSLQVIDSIVSRPDAVIISHWRAIALLKHYGVSMPFWCIEENHWKLDLGSRELSFVFTPYLHFPGAFCTFDTKSGILFSSDLFGGFTEKWSLVAEDETYFEAIRPFHEHYMPSREILYHALCKLEKLPLNMIAPQHGSIIKKELIQFMINQLKTIDCGLYLMTHTTTDIMRLTKLNRVLRDFMETMVVYRNFNDVVTACLRQIQTIIPAVSIHFFTRGADQSVTGLDMDATLKGSVLQPSPELESILGMTREAWSTAFQTPIYEPRSPLFLSPEAPVPSNTLVIPLFDPEGRRITSVGIIGMKEAVSLDRETMDTLAQLSFPLGIAVERETIYRALEEERQRFYNQSIRDPLTNLYTRYYMRESVERLFNIHDRHPGTCVGIISFDLDHFKSVNDSFGHSAGDEVLKAFGEILMRETRTGDIQVRMGGEEFTVFTVTSDVDAIREIAERIRICVTQMTFEAPMNERRFSVSCGVAVRKPGECLADAIHRSDMALYEAKANGRNQVCCIPAPPDSGPEIEEPHVYP